MDHLQQRDAGQQPTSIFASFFGTGGAGEGRAEGGAQDDGGGRDDGGGSGGSIELQLLEKVRDEVEQGRRSMESNKAALEQAAEATQSVIAQAEEAMSALSGALQRAEQVRAGSNSADAAAPTLLSEREGKSKKVTFATSNDAGAGEGRNASDLQAQVDQLAAELSTVRALVNENSRKMMKQAVLTTRAALRICSLSPLERIHALQELDMKAGSMAISTSR